MSESIVKLLLEEHQPELLDAIDRAAGSRLGGIEMQNVGSAVQTHLSAAVRRAYEMGYREALAARARAEAARSAVSVLAEESIGFAAAPPPTGGWPKEPAADEARDEGAQKVIAEMRALVSQWGEGAKPAEPTKTAKADLSLFGEALPEEADEDDEIEDADVEAADAQVADNEDEEAPAPQPSSPTDTLDWRDDELDEDDVDEDDAGSEERTSKPRIRRTNAEIAAIADRVFAFIKDHPGTKARQGREALGLEPADWAGAAKRLASAKRIFHAGATKARVYFAIEETKRGRPKKLTKTAFILALPFDLPAADIVAAGRRVGLELDDRYVHSVRTAERRRVKKEGAEARAKAITARFAAVVGSPREPEHYRELRRAYTQVRRTDGIWAACQALVTLGAAEDSEQAFYETRRTETAAHAQVALSPELRARHALDPAADPRVTMVIDYLLPALIERYGRPTVAQGYTEAHRADLSQHSLLSQTLVYAARVLGVELPPIYQHATAPVAIFSIHGDVPTIALGAHAAALTDGRDAAFVAANHLSYFLPGHYARRLVPQESELRRWVEAALELSRGASHFEHLSQLEQSMLKTQVDPDERKIIVAQTADLDPKHIDLDAWFKGVDTTADRLGLLLCNDLERACILLRGGEGTGDETTEARLDTLRAWSVSEDYLAVRAALGIAVE